MERKKLNQTDSIPFQHVPLPPVIGIAHSDADKSFPLVVLDELEGGSPLFPLLD